jgi:hypothetical protein
MRRVNSLVVLTVLLLTLVPLGFLAERAEATTACCAINANGTPIGTDSFLCNLSAAQTRRLAVGQYEVDFNFASILNFNKTCAIDGHTTGVVLSGECAINDRAGDTSSVFVTTRTSAGVAADRPFNVCIHRQLIIIQ